jgi:hypothetical protein
MGAISLNEPYTPMYPTPKSLRDLAEDNRKAREAGMTYGQWAAIHNQEIEPRKEADTSDPYSIASIQAYLDLYNTGMNDRSVSEILGWGLSKARYRRATIYRLPANVTQGRRAIKRRPVTVDDVLKQIKHPYEGRRKKAAPKGD